MIFKKKIPENIAEEHVKKAFRKIKEDGVPSDRNSRIYCVEFENEWFPPKYVISIANEFANGEKLYSKDFGSTEAWKYLKKHGFKIRKMKMPMKTIDIEENSTEVRINRERELEKYVMRNLNQTKECPKICLVILEDNLI